MVILLVRCRLRSGNGHAHLFQIQYRRKYFLANPKFPIIQNGINYHLNYLKKNLKNIRVNLLASF